jgi:hypothetical protein
VILSGAFGDSYVDIGFYAEVDYREDQKYPLAGYRFVQTWQSYLLILVFSTMQFLCQAVDQCGQVVEAFL